MFLDDSPTGFGMRTSVNGTAATLHFCTIARPRIRKIQKCSSAGMITAVDPHRTSSA